MKKYNILLIGLGNIGGHYLESLNKINLDLDIYIKDKNLQISKIFYKKFLVNNNLKKNIKIKVIKSFNDIKTKIDLAILSSTSERRYQIIKSVYDKVFVKNWIIEKVIAQNVIDLKRISKIIRKNNSKAYVSTIKKLEDIYKFIKDKFQRKIQYINFIGNNWGMACNSIHYIDLFEYLLNSKINHLYFLNNKKWFVSKRKFFFEVNGIILGTFQNGATTKIICGDSYPMQNKITIKLVNGKKIEIFDDKKFILYQKKIKRFKNQNLSDLMPNVIRNILLELDSGLTSIDSSITQHILLIKEFLFNWNKIYKKSDKKIYIT